MRYCFRIGTIPEGEPRPNTAISVRKISDGTNITTGITDANGMVCFTADGHYPPFYLHLTGIPGGDKFWRSDEHHGAGPISLSEVPIALRALGDGVVRGHLDSLAPSVNGLIVSLATGSALVAGYPVVNYTADTFTLTRPVSSTRIDRVVARVYPLGSGTTPGLSEFAILAGTEGAGATALTQSATVHEISLATVTVPTAGTLTLVDDRVFSNERKTDIDVARVSSFSTTSATEVPVTDASVTLDIPNGATTYYVIATVTCQQLETQVNTAWVLQNTYDPIWSIREMSSPSQVAIDSTGRVLIADTGQARLLILNSSGVATAAITGLTGITGVCVDSSDAIYVNRVYSGSTYALRKYNSALVQQWDTSATVVWFNVRHLATNSTNVYFTNGDFVTARLCSSGGSVTSWGGTGPGDGKFSNPWGIRVDGAYVWVADTGNTRLQQFSLAGSYVGKFSTPSPPYGITSIPTASILIVSFNAEHMVRRYDADATGSLIDSFSHPSPLGIDVTTDDNDIIWVSSSGSGTIAKFDEATTPGGYGQIAVEIDGVVGTYTGIGNRDGSVSNVSSGSKAGGSTVVVRAMAKATASTLTLKGIVLSARAIPQR